MSWLADVDAALAAGFVRFCFLDAVDEWPGGIRVTLRLVRPGSADARLVEATLGREAAELPSIADRLPAARWAERAVAESFGVAFAGNDGGPLLVRPGCGAPEHPLRKDRLVAARSAVAWPGARSDDGRARRRELPVGVPDPDAADAADRVSTAWGGRRRGRP